MSDRPPALPFCMMQMSGLPLPAPKDGEIATLLARECDPGAISVLLGTRETDGAERTHALAFDLEPDNLAEAGWGVLFGDAVTDEIRQALQPLLASRAAQAGANFFRFEGATGCRPGADARKWVAGHGASFANPDPRNGVPYYVMIVAAPDDISFEFQYDLDIQYAVGRLWFDRVEHFRDYAASIVAQEKGEIPARPREIGIVSTRHDGDAATQMFHDYVAAPLDKGTATHPPVGAAKGFAHTSLLDGAATRDALSGLMQREGGAPAVLLTGSHGLGLQLGDPGQLAHQGAVVCDDWKGQGPVLDAHLLSGANLPADANLAGMIHVFFACYGAGCPLRDNFAPALAEPPAIAPLPFIAALPQALLAHPRGSALAVIGHIERAWSYSFLNEFGQPDLGLFRNVLAALMQGARVGHALDQANLLWALHSTRLADRQREAERDPDLDQGVIEALWIARDDARNLVVLGDPAVRLRL